MMFDPFGRRMPSYDVRRLAAKARLNHYSWMRRHRALLVLA